MISAHVCPKAAEQNNSAAQGFRMGLLIGNLRIFKRAVFPLGDKLVIVKIAALVQLLIDLIQAIPLDQSRRAGEEVCAQTKPVARDLNAQSC